MRFWLPLSCLMFLTVYWFLVMLGGVARSLMSFIASLLLLYLYLEITVSSTHMREWMFIAFSQSIETDASMLRWLAKWICRLSIPHRELTSAISRL
ncbi:hypothetical protein K431DRAFT_20162 [Polychaeton citri CBS 116435]|uniref:Uncharacterized protein n=1 Tax=Polychaeton citri CBS 116435 TaxID=1314669 RepID=A0A9P4Q0Q9_9PEZI|nr:hypothetical protein K431DRAFT_20162 [Polychaeton citri CBS 116435]